MKGKNIQPRIFYLARLSFKFDREIKSFTGKQKLKDFSTNQTIFTRNVKGTSLSNKEKAITRKMKIMKVKVS